MRLGERLLMARTERGWRQADIARRFGVNQATICRAERGDSPSGVAARFIEMQLDKFEHDNPLPVVGSGEPPTGSAEEAAMPRGTKTGTGTRAKRTSQKRAQSGNQNYQGLPASHQKQLEQFGKKFGNLQSNFQTLMTNLGGGGTTASGRGGARSSRNQQTSQNI